MYLFFDTETTGLKNSLRIVQIGWSLTDQNGNELRTQCSSLDTQECQPENT